MTIDTMQAIQDAANHIKTAKCVVAFTGAGISTSSGIPDFRDPESGLWQHTDPMIVASLMGFRKKPLNFFNWVHPIYNTIAVAQPNAGHYALARMEELGHLQGIITQNIDGLHTAANSSTVYELHGHLRTATCTRCFTKYDATPLLKQFNEHGEIPICYCTPTGSVIKPDVILFGEQLPHAIVTQAEALILKADVLLVAGSSLQVAPANQIPFTAIQHGAKLIIINYEATPADSRADVVIKDDVNEVLPRMVALLDNEK